MSRPNTSVHLLLFLLIVIIFGCAPLDERPSDIDSPKGQFTLYLNGPDRTSKDITFDLSAINLVASDGTATEVVSSPVTINSLDVAGRQILLGESEIPENRYVKIQLIISQATIIKEGRMARLALPSETVEIPVNIYSRRKQNIPLFIYWNSDGSVTDTYLFRPVFTAKGKIPELSSLMAYVTNEDSDNISVINRQTGDVVASIMVGKKPRGIALSEGGDRLRVYVVNSGTNDISVIDPTTNKIVNEIPLRFGRGPEGIALVRISPEKEFLYVTNYESNSLSIVNAVTLQETDKVDVGIGPVAVAADPSVSVLSNARSLSLNDIHELESYRDSFFNIYVANKNSNTVSILRMDNISGRKEEVITVDVEWNPIALAVDYIRGKVYVANHGSDKLSIIDILEVNRGNAAGAVGVINNVGTAVIGIVPDTIFDRVYLLREMPGEVMVIRTPARENHSIRSELTPVMGMIPVGRFPRSIAIDPEIRKLYVVNRGSDTITVIDKTTKQLEQTIPVGRKPYGIAMFSEGLRR